MSDTTDRARDWKAFEDAWNGYPSQDNEGYLPDRAGFKCGFFAGLSAERARWESERRLLLDVKGYVGFTDKYCELYDALRAHDEWLATQSSEDHDKGKGD